MTAMFCPIFAVVFCYAVANLRRSTTGRQMLAVRSNERAAAAAGVSVAGTKILGSRLGLDRRRRRRGDRLPVRRRLARPLRLPAVAGVLRLRLSRGISSVAGAIIGGVIVSGGLLWTFLLEVVGISSDFTFLLGGIGLIAAAIFAPDGTAGQLRGVARRRRCWKPTR